MKYHLPFDPLHADYYPVRDHKLLFIVILADYLSLISSINLTGFNVTNYADILRKLVT